MDIVYICRTYIYIHIYVYREGDARLARASHQRHGGVQDEHVLYIYRYKSIDQYNYRDVDIYRSCIYRSRIINIHPYIFVERERGGNARLARPRHQRRRGAQSIHMV